MPTLRRWLSELTDALDVATFDDHVLVDPVRESAWIDSRLDDAERDRRSPEGAVEAPRPDGLWEWRVRRDFVYSLPREEKRRLSPTLGGPKTRRRFHVALSGDPRLVVAFRRYRRRRLRGWAARVLRVIIGARRSVLEGPDPDGRAPR
jgi:hypothetical protein